MAATKRRRTVQKKSVWDRRGAGGRCRRTGGIGGRACGGVGEMEDADAMAR